MKHVEVELCLSAQAVLHRAATDPGWVKRHVKEPTKEEGRGHTLGYNGRRYKRVFNPKINRHEWWEVEKVGKEELTPDQRDSVWAKVGVQPRIPKLKFIKRVPNSMVSKLWEAQSAKAERYARFWEAVQQAEQASLPLPKWDEWK